MIQHLPSQRVLAHSVEWMRTSAERTRGLLKYSSAPTDFAAIFKLPFGGFFPLVHTWGMKFAIDILFCDQSGVVKYRKLRVSPRRFVLPFAYFFGGCSYLVEFSGCDLNEVKIGDRLQWSES